MIELQGFVSDYIKGKKHLHLEIGVITKEDIEYHSLGNPQKKSVVASRTQIVRNRLCNQTFYIDPTVRIGT